MNQVSKRTTGNRIARAMAALTWGFGYLFGFSIVSVLSIGLVSSEEFSTLVEGRASSSGQFIFKRHGNLYLRSEYVAIVGWLFVAAMIFIATI